MAHRAIAAGTLVDGRIGLTHRAGRRMAGAAIVTGDTVTRYSGVRHRRDGRRECRGAHVVTGMAVLSRWQVAGRLEGGEIGQVAIVLEKAIVVATLAAMHQTVVNGGAKAGHSEIAGIRMTDTAILLGWNM